MLNLNYIAGLIDADGSISISVSKNRYKKKDNSDTSIQFAFIVNFRQVDRYRSIVEELQETLGVGKIYDFNQTGRSQPMITWQTTKEEETLLVCKTLLPYLRIKKDQAELIIQALEIWEQGRLGRRGVGYYHTEESKQQVLEISARMNPSQQKDTSRRNKEIRVADASIFGPNSKTYQISYPPEWAGIEFVGKEFKNEQRRAVIRA